MNTRATRTVALLSIHPEFSERIFDGSKTIELRRITIPKDLKHVIVYATSPVMKIIGYFDVDTVVNDTPSNIWCKYSSIAGIDEKRYFEYYGSRDRAVGIKIRQTHPLPTPRKITSLGMNLTPPQSIRYLPESTITKLRGFISQQKPWAGTDKTQC